MNAAPRIFASNSWRVVLCIMGLGLLCLAPAFSAEPKPRSRVLVDAQVGMGSLYRGLRYNPVQVDVTNLTTKELSGSVELFQFQGDRLRTVHRQRLHLDPGEKQRRVSFFFRGSHWVSGYGDRLDLRITGEDDELLFPRLTILGTAPKGGRALPRQASKNAESVNPVLVGVARPSGGEIFLGMRAAYDSGGLTAPDNDSERVYAFSIAYDRLPTRYLGYDMLDAVVLVEPELQRFPPGRWDALETWVRAGGHLIVVGVAKRASLNQPRLARLLPVEEVTDAQDMRGEDFSRALERLLLSSSDDGGSATPVDRVLVTRCRPRAGAWVPRIPAVALPALPSPSEALSIEYLGETLPLAYTHDLDMGAVTLLTFNPFQRVPRESSPTAYKNFMRALITACDRNFLPPQDALNVEPAVADQFGNPVGGMGTPISVPGMEQKLRGLLADFNRTRVSMWPLVALLIGYVLVAGPMPFFVMRKSRPYAGPLIGLGAAMFIGTAAFFAWSKSLELRQAQVNMITILDQTIDPRNPQPNRPARARRVFTIKSMADREYAFPYDNATSTISYYGGMARSEDTTWEHEQASSKIPERAPITSYGKKQNTFTARVPKWQRRELEAQGLVRLGGRRVFLDLRSDGVTVSGTVSNRTGRTLMKCRLLHRRFGFTLRDLADGEKITIRGKMFDRVYPWVDGMYSQLASRFNVQWGWGAFRGFGGEEPRTLDISNLYEEGLLWSLRNLMSSYHAYLEARENAGVGEAGDDDPGWDNGDAERGIGVFGSPEFPVRSVIPREGDAAFVDLSAELERGRAVFLSWYADDAEAGDDRLMPSFPNAERRSFVLYRVITPVPGLEDRDNR